MNDLSKMQVTTDDWGLQRRVMGVDTVNSGTPRGGISVNRASPLYVVDEMLVDGIEFINSSDIEYKSFKG